MIAMTTPVAVKDKDYSNAAERFATAIENTFDRLTDKERSLLLDCAKRHHYIDNETIIEEGSVLQAIYVLAEGEVRIERQGMTPVDCGTPVEVARLE